ncbi:MAG: hypothetical protein OXE43_02355 [Chloroflexi bacterium]|nr:hypothetical protein [Chloroflexota bacterium]
MKSPPNTNSASGTPSSVQRSSNEGDSLDPNARTSPNTTPNTSAPASTARLATPGRLRTMLAS